MVLSQLAWLNSQTRGVYEFRSHRDPDTFSVCHFRCWIPHAFGLDQSDRIRGNDGLPCGHSSSTAHTRDAGKVHCPPSRILSGYLTTQTATAWRLLGNAWPFYFRMVPSCSSPLKLATLQPIPAAMQPGGSVVAWAELALGPYLPPHCQRRCKNPHNAD